MRVLLDTDVVLDVLLARPPFVAEAATIWLEHEQRHIEAFISPITPVNVFYIVRKARSLADARTAVNELLATLYVCPADDGVLKAAYALPMTDYEDAVQAAAATAFGLDALITRNTADYVGAPLPILTPADLLSRLAAP